MKFKFGMAFFLMIVVSAFSACSRSGASGSRNSAQTPGIVADTATAAVLTQTPEELAAAGFRMDGTAIEDYTGHGGSVVIPDGVTRIGNGAFFNKQLISVVIPNSVTSIGDRAFANNYTLASADIGSNVTLIGDGAFANNKLTSAVIPGKVISIGVGAFNLNQLTSVVIPNSVTSIGDMAFKANRLTTVVIPNSVTIIGGRAFADNQLTAVTVPNSITHIGKGAFEGNQLPIDVINSIINVYPGFELPKKMYVNSFDGLRGRAEPSTASGVVKTFLHGHRLVVQERSETPVTIDGITGRWCKLSEPYNAWVFGGYLSDSLPSDAPAILDLWGEISERMTFERTLIRFTPDGEYGVASTETSGHEFGKWKLNGNRLTLIQESDRHKVLDTPVVKEVTVFFLNENEINLVFPDTMEITFERSNYLGNF